MCAPLLLHSDSTELDALRKRKREIESSLRLEPVREDKEVPRDCEFEVRKIDPDNPDLTESGRVIVSLCTTHPKFPESDPNGSD